MQSDLLGAAVKQCPFLAKVGARQGEAYARNLAANPFASASAGPVLLEDGLSSFAATLKLFHGPGGVVPLKRFAADGAPAATAVPASGCPFHAAAAQTQAAAPAAPAASTPAACPAHTPSSPDRQAALAAAPAKCRASAAAAAASTAAPGPAPLARAPFASMSLSGFGFMPDPGQFFNRQQRAKQHRAQQQKQQRKPGPGTSTGGSPNIGGSGSRGASGTGRLHPGGSGGGAGGSGWQRVLGGLLPLAANGHLQCPAPIVKMRAAIAALKPVRDLRPQALPIRALAMGGTAVAANLPCGAWREHTRKFSPQWFLAVHATIPFVAMLRKAVLMPKWAILLTIVGSVAGQSVGARIERQRLQQLSSRRSQAAAATPASLSSTAPQAPEGPANDCVMPSLDAGCRRCLQAAGAAIAWTLAPVVVN